ncbi:MAG: hypothetical protein ACE5L6_00355 [Candidatus Bathyarchaeia archaeon]
MSKFQQEVERLRSILEQGYLQKDSRVTTIRGAHLMLSTVANNRTAFENELKNMQTHGFNTIRTWAWWPWLISEEWLSTVNKYDLKAVIVLPVPIDAPPWQCDPFDYITVAEWENALNPVLNRYGSDPRILAWEIISEPYIKPEHYQDFKDVINYVKSKSTLPVTVGFDEFTQIPIFHEALDIISYHVYQFGEWATSPEPRLPWEILDTKLTDLEQFGKPILIGEIGFPTWYYWKYERSDYGNTPYKIPGITRTTRETEQLQYDYFANMLHIIKEHNIFGYIMWQWLDDQPSGEGGFGLKGLYPDLRPKPAMALFP